MQKILAKFERKDAGKKTPLSWKAGKNITPIPGIDSGDQQNPGCYKVY